MRASPRLRIELCSAYVYNPKNVLGEYSILSIVRVFNYKTTALKHRLEQPGEGRVFVSDVFLEVSSDPAFIASCVIARAPRFYTPFSRRWFKVINCVLKAKDTARSQDAVNTA